MRTRVSRGFTLIELLVVIAIIGTLIALLLPALNMVREAANKSKCGSNMHNMIVALKTYEETYKHFPNSTKIPTGSTAAANNTNTFNAQKLGSGSAGKPASGDAGYSWLVQLLPFIEETTLYNAMAQISNKFTSEPAFSTKMVQMLPASAGSQGANTRHFSTISIPVFLCPSFSGEAYIPVDNKNSVTDSAYKSFQGVGTNGPYGVAITNYVPLCASHIECMMKTPATGKGEPPNGVIVPGSPIGSKSMSDGSAKTAIACESKEQYYASWYDGTTAWSVACWPDGTQPTQDKNSGWWTVVATDPNSSSALMKGPKPDPTVFYSQKAVKTVNSNLSATWQWGPSSDHTAGAVMHVFGDGGTRAILSTVDPNAYMHIVTRAGSETDTGDIFN